MNFDDIVFSSHAVQRMFERSINTDDILSVLDRWDIIEQYPYDTPFPSFLILGFIHNKPLHIVTAIDDEKNRCYIITVYQPDNNLWDDKFRKRMIK